MLVDFSAGDEPVGGEILEPGARAVVSVNEVLKRLGLPILSEDEAKPLLAA